MANVPTKTRAKPTGEISTTFVPRFWEQADSRLAIVRAIKERYEALKEDAGADSIQKQLLCQRAVFLSVWLETVERKALEDSVFAAGEYTQSVNALSGLLSKLGLSKVSKRVGNLREYVRGTA